MILNEGCTLNCLINFLTRIFEDYDHKFQKTYLFSPNFFIVCVVLKMIE